MFAVTNMKAEGNKIINGLWIGETLSPLELLTISSFINNGHSFRLWVYRKPRTELPAGAELCDANEILSSDHIFRYKYNNQFGHGKNSLAGFSDLFRYKLLFEKGGWWVDMDVTCLKPFDFEDEYVFRPHHKLKIVGNIIKCPAQSPIMKDCFETALKQVNAENRDWLLPIRILNDNLLKYRLEGNIKEISNKDSWYQIRTFLGKKIVPENTWYALHWNNEEWGRNGIDKNSFITRSLFGSLLQKNGIAKNGLGGLNALKYRFKLTLTYFVINYFYKRLV